MLQTALKTIPAVDVSNYLLPTSLSMQLEQVLIHPHNKVVFECPFDYLMKKVGR
jgi:hypothetical protein